MAGLSLVWAETSVFPINLSISELACLLAEPVLWYTAVMVMAAIADWSVTASGIVSSVPSGITPDEIRFSGGWPGATSRDISITGAVLSGWMVLLSASLKLRLEMILLPASTKPVRLSRCMVNG